MVLEQRSSRASTAHLGRHPTTIYYSPFTIHFGLSVSADRQRLVNAAVRARDDVYADEFADSSRGGSARVRCGLHGGNVAAHDCRDEARADLLVSDERDVGGFYHRVRGLDHRHKPFRLNHAE